MDLVTLRTALIITLSILLVVLLWRKLRERWAAKDMPVPLHAEVTALEVVYHPERLRLELSMPADEVVRLVLLDAAHRPCHNWNDTRPGRGGHTIELALPVLPDGVFHLEMRTSTQRTERTFRLQRT